MILNPENEVHKEYMKQLIARNGAMFTPKLFGPGKCDHCEQETDVAIAPVRTAYYDDSKNVAPTLCKPCMDEYNEHWDEMWSYTNGW